MNAIIIMKQNRAIYDDMFSLDSIILVGIVD